MFFSWQNRGLLLLGRYSGCFNKYHYFLTMVNNYFTPSEKTKSSCHAVFPGLFYMRYSIPRKTGSP